LGKKMGAGSTWRETMKTGTMESKTEGSRRILLSGVFGPFGVDDEFGRKENIMELFHNQVTREQGLASFRFHHRSFGLYFLAENIEGDVTVLDFPTRKRFEAEVRKGYDVVGISFITPNFVKAREMARIVRRESPRSTIVLGGHGTAIEGIENLVDCDHVVRGEGIRPLRSILGQDPDAPIRHPILPSAERSGMFGITVPGVCASTIVPGVGCVNGCRFCCTSHFFGKTYTPYVCTGKQLFDMACAIEDERGGNEIFVMDENFLKDKRRAMELVEEMERNRRFFEFHIFSSAEAISEFGLDNMERLGVTYVWIGVESSSDLGNYAKNKGSDPKRLIRSLRERGIIVLASGILCMEHHTPENIGIDIDFMVGLEADFVQFMLLTPLPVTALYRDMQARGLLREDLPFEEWHGQNELSWRHPAFPGDSAARCLKAAFRKDYEVNSSSMYRVLETQVRGYKRLAAMRDLDPCLEARKRKMQRRMLDWAAILGAVQTFAVNDAERSRAEKLEREINELKPGGMARSLRRAGALGLAAVWNVRLAFVGDALQPATILTRYPASGRRSSPIVLPVFQTQCIDRTAGLGVG